MGGVIGILTLETKRKPRSLKECHRSNDGKNQQPNPGVSYRDGKVARLSSGRLYRQQASPGLGCLDAPCRIP
ncbi:unnamed protein product [Lampetra planeri]